jgi:hypothetical protein
MIMAENLLRYGFPREDEESVASVYEKIKSYSSNIQQDLSVLTQELREVLKLVKTKED